ncbi:Uncharacterized protein dnm_090840 [Desulfonema magnum]|uniref:Uncharacterized protein n=1 Tax=Desulfonema magnum TaxID=45655 RepID=A0A975BWF1_9BACT|nr:Uncharacterized protein dnm_090840 [Desulfonema magnum]
MEPKSGKSFHPLIGVRTGSPAPDSPVRTLIHLIKGFAGFVSDL